MRVFLAIVMLIAASFGFGVVMSNQHSDMLPSVRSNAIANGCGGYNRDSGLWSWEKGFIMSELEIPLKSMEPKGISIDSLPKPIRKPPVPKKVQ